MFNFLKKDKEVKEYIFSWKGKDKKGKIVNGEIRAATETLVKVSLRTRGITVSKIKKQAEVAVFTRQLATMLKSGVPILQSFDIVATGNKNPSVTKLLNDIKGKVESGSLDQMLNKVADIYEDEVDDTVSSISSLIEPIIIFLGVVIGGLVIAMYLPIFKMASAV